MPAKSKNKKSLTKLIKLPVFIFMIILVYFLYEKLPVYLSKKNLVLPGQLEVITRSITKSSSNSVPTDWRIYDIKEYRVAFKTPPLLLKRQYNNQNEYLFFMKFEENKFSEDKGVAVGITNRSVSEEVIFVKNEISKLASLVPKEVNTKVDGFEAVKITYEKEGNFEARSIVAVSDGKVTVSVSTTPDQIDALSNSLDFY